jgi:O-antigen/teichoic acid export membrane protein
LSAFSWTTDRGSNDERIEQTHAGARPVLKTLIRHSYWNAVATFSHQGSTFVSNFLVIKLLDHAAYGKFSLVNLTAFYAAAILQFAVGSTASRFVARYADDRVRLFSVIWICGAFSFASGLLGFGILVLASGFLSRSVFIEPSLLTPIAIVSLSVPSLVGMVFLSGLLQGLHSFRTLAVSSVASGVLFVAVVAGGAWADGLNGAIIGFVAGSTLRSLIMGGLALLELGRKETGGVLSWRSMLNRPIRHELFKFQVPAGLAAFLTVPTLWLIPTILTRNTQNFSEVASYSVILMIKSLIVLPASVIALALQPSAEKALGAAQVNMALRVFRTASVVSLAIVAASALLFAVFAKEVMAIFGRDFISASGELQLMMLGAVAEAAAVGLYMRVQATNRMWASIFATLLPRDLVMLAIALMFTSSYGLHAVIIAHVVGAVVNLAGIYWLSYRAIRSLKMS